MVANNYLNDGITNAEVVELIVLGYTGKLLDWWNNCMTAASKDDIKHAIQKKKKKYIYIYIYKGGRDTTLEAEAQLYSDNIT